MDVLRTPDSAFAAVPDFDFPVMYTNITADDGTSMRVAHVDAGDKNAPNTILCMHGEPSWSFLYRTMIPVLTAAGHRVVAPDLIGFGRSDKPTQTTDYTYERHVDWMSQWLVANDLRSLTLVCQDWGSLIGLRLVTAFPDRFDRVVLGNGGLPTGDPEPNAAFKAWREFSQKTPVFETSKIIQGGCTTKPLAPEVLAAYDAPYPDESYKAGARIFPTLVPASLDYPSSKENLAAWEILKKWTKPFHCAFSDSDPVTKNGEWTFRKQIPGCET
ncbi:MAG: alpha/beta fold hydrolase, partial [Acidimicrobiia bacterium]|nr:alpha/beta fold hydrolase [Acidimicrobiia bacterium]